MTDSPLVDRSYDNRFQSRWNRPPLFDCDWFWYGYGRINVKTSDEMAACGADDVVAFDTIDCHVRGKRRIWTIWEPLFVQQKESK